MKPEAIFFDVDGTLVSFNTHRVPASTSEALDQLRNRGIKTFVATGRMPVQMEIVGEIPFDGYITYNGAACFDGAWNPISSTPLPKEAICRLLAYLEMHELTVGFMYADSNSINRIDQNAITAAIECGEPPAPVRDPRIALEESVFQANIYVGAEEEERLMREIFTGCDSTRWHPLFCDINAAGVNKQAGMDQILNHFDILRSATMAFGDGGNDIPMLRHAAVGIAMGNAKEEVKQHADHITASVDEEGIAQALRHFGLI